MNILLSSYTCGAGRGGEPGVGWNVARGLALRGHHVTVVTSPHYREQTQQAIEREGLDIRLVHVDNSAVSNYLVHRHVWWQKKVANILREEAKNGHYDVVHHVTFNQYRGLQDVFKAGLPYVVGPVGGAECVPLTFLLHGCLGPAAKLKEILRYFKADAIPPICRCNSCRSRGRVFASNPSTAERLNKGMIRLRDKACVLPAIAIQNAEISDAQTEPDTEAPFMLLYASLSRPEKGIGPVLEAFSAYLRQGGALRLIVVGMKEEEIAETPALMQRMDIPASAMEWHTFVPRATMLDMMRRASAVLYTAYRDSGSMSVLEAVALGSNVLCFDIDSQAWLPEEFAVKIPVPSVFAGKAAVVNTLVQGMQQVENLPARTEEWHRSRVEWLRRTMTWEGRIEQLEKVYRDLVS